LVDFFYKTHIYIDNNKMATNIISSELDFHKKLLSYPKYKLQKKLPEISNSVTLDVAGGQESLFQLGSMEVMNLGKTHLRGDVYVEQSDAATTLSTHINTLGLPLIRSIQFFGDSYNNIVDINNVDVYLNAVLPCETKMGDFVSNDTPIKSATAALVKGCSPGLSPTTVENAVTIRPNGTTINKPQDIQYTVGETKAGALNVGDGYYKFDIPLSQFKNTFFALNKDVAFGTKMNIRIIWNTYIKVAYSATGPTNAYAGAIAYAPETVGPTISNLALWVALEQNASIKQQILAKVREGTFKIITPYVHSNKKNIAGSSHALSYTYRPLHGFMLKKVYTVPMVGTETAANSYNHSLLAGGTTAVAQSVPTFTSYYTLLNGSMRLQDTDITIGSNDAYSIHSDKLKGSSIQDSDMFNYSFAHVDQFGGSKPLWEDQDEYDNNVISGLPLDSDTLYDYYANHTASFTKNYYTFAVTLRKLTINSTGYVMDQAAPTAIMS